MGHRRTSCLAAAPRLAAESWAEPGQRTQIRHYRSKLFCKVSSDRDSILGSRKTAIEKRCRECQPYADLPSDMTWMVTYGKRLRAEFIKYSGSGYLRSFLVASP